MYCFEHWLLSVSSKLVNGFRTNYLHCFTNVLREYFNKTGITRPALKKPSNGRTTLKVAMMVRTSLIISGGKGEHRRDNSFEDVEYSFIYLLYGRQTISNKNYLQIKQQHTIQSPRISYQNMEFPGLGKHCTLTTCKRLGKYAFFF